MLDTAQQIQRKAFLLTALFVASGYALVGLLVLLAAVVWEGVTTRRIPWARGPMDWPFLAFLGAFLASGIVSAYHRTSLGALLIAALTIYLGYGISYRLLRHEPALRGWFGGAWFVGGVVAATWATVIGRTSDHPAALPQMAENALGTVLIAAFFLGLQSAGAKRPIWRVTAGGAMAVMLGAMVLADARGAWVGLAVGLPVFFSLVPRAYIARVLTVGAVVILVTVLLTPASFDALGRFRSIVGVETQRDRLALADSATAIFRDHPVVGTGLNTFIYVHPRYPSAYKPDMAPRSSAHNIFLNMAAEGGILGLASFFWIVVAALVAGIRWHAGTTAPPERLAAATVVAGFVGVVVQQQFDATIMAAHISTAFWLLIAVMAAAAQGKETVVRREPLSLLIVSNGYGEDAVGGLLAQQLRPHVKVVAYPLIGAGGAYADVPRLDPRLSLPSGGFGLRGHWRSFLADARAGSIAHWRRQWKTLRNQRNNHNLIVAVGDVYCLWMAAFAGRPVLFIATAKSEYNEPHRWMERVMIRRLASLVFGRDETTAAAFRRKGIPARHVGNTLMDTIVTTRPVAGREPTVTLLPGSRAGATQNVPLLLQLAERVGHQMAAHFLCALAPSVDPLQVESIAAQAGWSKSGDALERDGVRVVLTQAFGDAIAAATVVVGLAGTANEQAAGLGKPVVAFPARGPQFTRRFMELQRRLLGESLVATQDWREAADAVVRLLRDPAEQARRGAVGRERMGGTGAVQRIAEEILQMLRAQLHS